MYKRLNKLLYQQERNISIYTFIRFICVSLYRNSDIGKSISQHLYEHLRSSNSFRARNTFRELGNII